MWGQKTTNTSSSKWIPTGYSFHSFLLSLNNQGNWYDGHISDLKVMPKIHICTPAFDKGQASWTVPFCSCFSDPEITWEGRLPSGERQWSPAEGSCHIPWVLTRQPDIWSTLGERRPHPHRQSYFCFLTCWSLTRSLQLALHTGSRRKLIFTKWGCMPCTASHKHLQSSYFLRVYLERTLTRCVTGK